MPLERSRAASRSGIMTTTGARGVVGSPCGPSSATVFLTKPWDRAATRESVFCADYTHGARQKDQTFSNLRRFGSGGKSIRRRRSVSLLSENIS